ncbi:MAG: ABC-2 family transporter protein [bacterium]|nr:ABC-2 family transporter protein [bacterium]
MRHYAEIYWAFFKTTLAVQFQYRVAMSIYMIGRLLEPIVYLVVWATVATTQGGAVGNYKPADFSAYYIVLMVVNQFTFTWIMHEYDYRIRQGALSVLLLKPIHPIHADIADNIAYKILMSVIVFPTAVLLYALFDPNLIFQLQTFALFLCSLVLAFLMRFFVEWSLALVAFWTTRTEAVNQMYFTLGLFLSGRIAPIELLPTAIQRLADALPFRWAVAFPVELLLGRLSVEQIWHGFEMQVTWLIISLVLLSIIWRRGIRKYAAVGA